MNFESRSFWIWKRHYDALHTKIDIWLTPKAQEVSSHIAFSEKTVFFDRVTIKDRISGVSLAVCCHVSSRLKYVVMVHLTCSMLSWFISLAVCCHGSSHEELIKVILQTLLLTKVSSVLFRKWLCVKVQFMEREGNRNYMEMFMLWKNFSPFDTNNNK